jgi:hypothetical protein
MGAAMRAGAPRHARNQTVANRRELEDAGSAGVRFPREAGVPQPARKRTLPRGVYARESGAFARNKRGATRA